jgi:hypothetical protein
MNKFRKLGFIQYHGEIHINDSLLSCCPARERALHRPLEPAAVTGEAESPSKATRQVLSDGFACVREHEYPHHLRVSTAPYSTVSTDRRSTDALPMSAGKRRTPSPTNDMSDQTALNSINRLELLSGGIRRTPPVILSDVMRSSVGAPSNRSG